MDDHLKFAETEPTRELPKPVIDVIRDGVADAIKRARTSIVDKLESRTSILGRAADLFVQPTLTSGIAFKFKRESFPPDMGYYGGPADIKPY